MKKPICTQNRILAALVVATGLILAAGAFAIWPSYANPESRFYTSAIGFLKVQRLLGMPMEAVAQHPVWHDFTTPILGEGTMQCDFYNVPLVPAARVTALYVEEGDTVDDGKLLAELDDTTATLNLRSAELGLATAIAQRARVEAGTVNTLVAERSERSDIGLDGLGKVMKAAEDKVGIYRKLAGTGAASHLELVSAESDLASAQMNFSQAQVDAKMANAGLPKSKEIAEDAIKDAENLLKQRKEELKYYRVMAPASGTIDRVLIRDGEYNQNAGNPGFIIASGLWFEASLDQRALTDIHEGMEATVNLEAYAGRPFRATVQRIVPIVTFNAGGPETKTPVRPLGTGTPEWPATFTVRLVLKAPPNVRLVPGMTGFARVTVHHRKALAIPREALSSLSAGKGVVRMVDDSGRPVTTPVSLGEVDEHFVEITAGLEVSDWILSNNPRFLRDDDKIHIIRTLASGD
jgi:HlyD family secretion protein